MACGEIHKESRRMQGTRMKGCVCAWVGSACPILIKWGLITIDCVTGGGRRGGGASKRNGCGDLMRGKNLHDWSPAHRAGWSIIFRLVSAAYNHHMRATTALYCTAMYSTYIHTYIHNKMTSLTLYSHRSHPLRAHRRFLLLIHCLC